MFDIETMKIIKEFGYGVISLAFCFWLVKEIVMKMGKSLDMLIAAIQNLQNRIEFWNRESEVSHSAQKLEHEKILEKLSLK